MNNNYYVYVYYRLDTNEPFYVGKGKGDRWKHFKGRNRHFINIVDKIPTTVIIEKENLTENEAFYWEEKIIEILVFEYGFSIDILNNRYNDHYCHLVNKTWGGEGVSRTWNEKERKRKSELFKGENNPMYGKTHSEETKRKLSETRKGKGCGEDNPFYGKHHTEETKKKTRGKNNYGAKQVICITTGKIFDTVKEGGKYYKCSPSTIIECCKNKKSKSAGCLEDGTKLVWMYLDDYKKACKKEIEEKINNSNIKHDKRAKLIFCITNKTTYHSARQCSEILGINRKILKKCCEGDIKFILIDGIEYKFKYLVTNK